MVIHDCLRHDTREKLEKSISFFCYFHQRRHQQLCSMLRCLVVNRNGAAHSVSQPKPATQTADYVL